MEQKDRKRLGKTDLALIGLLLVIGLSGFLAVRLLVNQDGAAVRISIDGELYGTYPLSQEQTIPVCTDGAVTNTVQISEQEAKMIEADCPDQLCVHQRAVSRQGETIVCLPNRVVVEVTGEQGPDLDAVSQ